MASLGPIELLDPRFLHKLESLAIVARRLATGRDRGERASTQAGSGIAFASHRPYAPGDDFRFLDWKVFARSERLYVKQFEEERDLALHLVIDCSASMSHDRGAKFRRARELAAALGYIALVNLDRVSVCSYAAEAGAHTPPLRGRNRALVLLRRIAELESGGTTDLKRTARTLCARAERGGLALVISDGFEEQTFLSGIDLLRYGGLEPLVLLVLDGADATPDARGEVTFVDVESGRERTVVVNDRTVARHRAAYDAYFAQLRAALRERGLRVAEVDVHMPLERAVLDLLRRTGVVA